MADLANNFVNKLGEELNTLGEKNAGKVNSYCIYSRI